ncbi:MAG: hypothetical protein N2115_08690 [bacterium]|nr:hypothetical protein [bacterium]
MEKKHNEKNLKIFNFLFFLNPLILALIAIYMKRSLSYQPSPEFYEINRNMRIVQYFLYLSGLTVFFFIDGILNILRKRIQLKNLPISPLLLNIITLAILDYIALSGFLGFLISGNISWVIIFCAISFFSGFRFFPIRRSTKEMHA